MGYKINLRSLMLDIFLILMIALAQFSIKMDKIYLVYLADVFIIFFAFFCKKEVICSMMLFLLTDNRIFEIKGISIQLFLIIIYLLKFSLRENFNKKLLLMCILFSCYCFLYYIYGGLLFAIQGIKLSLIILFLTSFFSDKSFININSYKFIIDVCFKGVVYSIIIAILINPSMLDSGRFSLSSDSNWNLLGIFSGLIFSHSFIYYYLSKEKKYMMFSIIMLVCTLLTTSRTAFLVIVLSLLWVFLLFNSKKSDFKKKAILLLLIFIIFILIILNFIHFSYLDKLIDRIIFPRRGDISNGRFTLWTLYLKYLFNHTLILLFGFGTPLVNGITTLTNSNSFVAHNMYIEQTVMYGLIGNFLIILIYLCSYKIIKHSFIETYKVNKLNIKFAINIVLIFIVGLFSHLLTSVLVTFELYLGIYEFLILSCCEEIEK